MDDKQAMPADGGDDAEGAPDGVNGAGERGRTPGGESGGGGYEEGGPRPDGSSTGFMGHGGQTDIAYHGGGQAGDQGPRAGNGTTGGEDRRPDGVEAGPKPGPGAPYGDRVAEQTRDEDIGGRTIEVFEDSGVAAAEATGNTGVEGQRRHEGEQPGSG